MPKPKRRYRRAFWSFKEAESFVRSGPPTTVINERAPKVFDDISGVYRKAIGAADLFGSRIKVAGFAQRGKNVPTEEEDAAEVLVHLALHCADLVRFLYKQNPEVCRAIARTLNEWPLTADLTKQSWQQQAQALIEDLGVGSAVAGFIQSARTAGRNPIRRYAATIYETLYQTRWLIEEAHQNLRSRENCPAWAAKTLSLPQFIKKNVRPWAALGREMLLQQRPDFLNDPALKEQKFKWTLRAVNRSRSGKASERAIQNEAFDDFTKELRNLAPAEEIYRGEW